MNRIHRVVRNKSTGLLQVASETAKAHGSGSIDSSASGHSMAGCGRVAMLALSMALAFGSAIAQELPTGGQIVSGTGSISQAGNVMTVNQGSDKLITEWQSFGVGAGAKVQFVQPGASSVALARVIGSDVSVIQGQLSANGQLFLVNPNGILFTPTAQVNVGGLVASTLNISNDDFMAGNYNFSGASGASVVNAGQITAANGGTVALIAAKITNLGEIHAERGNVLMGAGSKVALDLGGPVKLIVNEGAIDALIEQGGAIRADGGLVYLTAKSASELAGTVISHTGITEAKTLASGERGQIFLLGDMVNDKIVVNGTLDASAPVGGDGGFIETSAAKVEVQGGVKVTTLAATGKHGEYLIDPTDFYITAGADPQTDAGIGNSTLVGLLNGGNVTIQTVGVGAENGDIYANADVIWSANTRLRLEAFGSIYVNSVIHASNTGSGRVELIPLAGGTINFGTSGLIGISNTDQLNNLSNISHGAFRQYANIDLGGSTINPITFRGSYDGGGFTIANAVGSNGYGLFQTLAAGSSFTNLTLDNFSISGSGSSGALASVDAGSSITNVTVQNSVISGEVRAGGLVGQSANAAYGGINISNVTIKRADGVGGVGFGGIAGSTNNTSISGSDLVNVTLESEKTTGTSATFGGVVGEANASTITTTNVQSTFINTGGASIAAVGGVVGTANNTEISDSTVDFDFNNASGVTDQVGGIAGIVSGTSTLQRDVVSVNIDITTSGGTNNIGGAAGGVSGPSVLADNITVTGDINITAGSGQTIQGVGGIFGASDSGLSDSSFSGSISTQGGSASGLGGALGILNGAALDNISVSADLSAEGSFGVGGLVGVGLSGLNAVQNSDYTGQISLGAGTHERVGGAVGSSQGTIDLVSVNAAAMSVDPTAQLDDVGGLVGFQNGGSITSSSADMALTAPGVAAAERIGGLVGSTSGTVSITSSTASGSMAFGDDATDIGGLVGSTTAQTTIDGSSSSTAVAVGDDAENIGGLVGVNNSNQILSSSASGSVTAGDRAVSVGGLVGAFSGAIDNVTSVSSVTVGSDAQDIGGVFGKVTGATVDQVSAIVNVTAGDNAQRVGGLAGGVSDVGINTLATNVTVSGSINLGDNAQDVGGLVGLAPTGTFSDNNVDVNITAGSGLTDAGGLIGDNRFGTVITNSTAGGDITATSGATNVGGLIGLSDYFDASDLSASGNISLGDGATNVGGLMGSTSGNQTRVSASGDVAVGNGSTNVGGLFGNLQFGTVQDSNASGSVDAAGATNVGGLVGNANFSSIENSRYEGAFVNGGRHIGGIAGTGGTLVNTVYNIDATQLNGSRQVTRGGLYANQYADFMADGVLDIADYSASLPLDVDGYHVISDAQGLKDMLGFAGNFGMRFRLANDIVAPAGWTIPLMRADFDGANHTISGVNLTALENDKIGLFGENFGFIENLRVSGSVSGLDQVGMVAAINGGFILNVYGFGTAAGEGTVGGLVGVNNGGIGDSMTNVDVTASMIGGKAGGLVGSQMFGGVYDVYAEGDVSGDVAGGLIGENTQFASIIKGYASGAVNGNTTGGAVAVDDLSGMTQGLFWDLGSTGQATSAAGLGMSTANMMKIENFTTATAANGGVNPDFDFNGLWTHEQDVTRPRFGLAAAPAPAPAPPPAPAPSPSPAPAPVQSTGDECVLIESLDVGCFRPEIAKPVESNTQWIQSSSIRADGFEGSAVISGQVPEVTFSGNEVIFPADEDSAEKPEVSPQQ